MYAILDIETTGGSPKKEKITEIAIFLHDGKQITDEYCTLINPEKSIPYFITQLTGITNKMVANAPKFYEIAKNIVEITDNKIIVAHNANFDYGFIQAEFEKLGYEFNREKICTIKLSRKLIPGKKSYSLGKLCNELDININGRHRAAGDALATVKLFERLINLNGEKPQSDNLPSKETLKKLHPEFNLELLKKLPEKPGVYYLYNNLKDIIYIGKSKNLKKRILSHFSNNQSKRAIEMQIQIADIYYEQTGNELIALLLESEEIKKHKPKFNRAQRRTVTHWGLFSFIDDKGYVNLKIDKNSIHKEKPITCFENLKTAKNKIEKIINEYNLCQKLCGMYKANGPCFHYQIGECNGACIGKEHPTHYNTRALQAINSLKFDNQNMLIIDKGRHFSERTAVKIENGKYLGFGFFDCECIGNNLENIHDCIKKYNDNHEIQRIIKSYIDKNKIETIISY